MKKFLSIFILLLIATTSFSQAYNNEWIDYSKTYYKFKIPRNAVYRINQSTLVTAGLQNVPVEQFQLLRNGKEETMYTSVASGPLPAGGYIEIWGKQNDGKPDNSLYKNPANQLNDAYSFETDTASYFLTINPAGGNKRFINSINDVAGNTLPPDPYFMYHFRIDFKDQINRGKAVNYGEYVYSSTYDVGELWTTGDIHPDGPANQQTGSLHVAASGPQATLSVCFTGNSFLGNGRTVKTDINDVNFINAPLLPFEAKIITNSAVPLSAINAPTVKFTLSNVNSNVNDRVAASFLDLLYPRVFDFDGKANFLFTLAPNAQGNYLEIQNFMWSGPAPVLYDFTSQKRYVANTSVNGLLRFALPASAVARDFVLVNQDATNVFNVNSLTQRNFINFASSSNQGDYLIISNKILFPNNTVENYRQYRSSAAGGSYNAKIYDIDELTDQFAFGIKKHPISIHNFLRYARKNFAAAPKMAFLIGKAVTYDQARINESSPYIDQLNLVPTFGWPASDNILASENLDPLPATHIGRLSAVNTTEVNNYLDKVKLFEQQQANTVQTIDNKAWMKTMVHVVGANDASLDASLTAHLNSYRDIVIDTFYGASVTSFNKTSTGPVTPITNALMQQLFENGISLLNYFGHSAATALDYNLNSPDQYNNYGKYPVFLVNGCSAGNIFSFDTSRLGLITSLSELYVLAKDRGSIGFIASTHFGVESYLDNYCKGFYQSLSIDDYNEPVTYNIYDALNYLLSNKSLDSTTRYLHAEENVLHGDPAIKINAHAKPDFVIEEPQVIINPTFISVASGSFDIKTYIYNIGKALGDSVSFSIKRQYPNGNIVSLFSQNIKSVRYIDSVKLTVPVVASTDVGENKLIVTIDDNNKYDELSELNNTVTKSFFIYEDELKPDYPYNFAIVNKQGIKLVASTANPIAPLQQYNLEMDTTELFNSPLKYNQSISSVGGALEFNAGIPLTDSTVYYWRVAPVPTDGVYHWNTSSFVYLPGSSFGYNQSHLYQHLKSTTDRIYIDSFSRKWNYDSILSSMQIINSIFGFSGIQDADFQVQINGYTISSYRCMGHSVVFNVFDPVTLKPLYNQAIPSTNPSGSYGGFMGSGGVCGKIGSQYNFEFSYMDTTGRRKMRDFMDWIANGYIVTARLFLDQPLDQTPFVDVWKNDATVYGAGNTVYDRMINVGFSGLDSFTYARTWAFVYKKNTANFSTSWDLSDGLYDKIILDKVIISPDSLGIITSPSFGPAKAWKSVKWRGYSLDNKAGDNVSVDVIGVNLAGAESVLYTLNMAQQDFNISSVSPVQYPFIKLRMRNADSINLTPYQLRYWRILYDPVPEGALAPNILYTFKDTLGLGEKTNFSIAFKNVSETAFADSIAVNLTVYDANNVGTNIIIPKLKALNPGDTATINTTIDSKNYNGLNNLYLDVNPNNAQPEQFHFNNFLYKNFLVSTDNYKPTLDVTFDGVHILNNDIVSATPRVLIKMKDESKYLLLDDTSLFSVQLVYPDGSQRRFYFNTDTLVFTPATGSADNIASVDFTPYLLTDGTYRLLVHGQDKTGNPAGFVDYTVSFNVYNKPMITNLFNYPNPFTTSTAFAFTVTGSVLPQNIRIQILTITGKIVREITSAELGPLHIGRNITDFKWDGTDQYGQKLGNGVYLYRVLTNLNGKALDKFPTYDSNGNQVDTDKYFNKGYGKMYLMR